MSLMIMKRAIPKAFRGTMFEDIMLAKDFFTKLEKRLPKMKRKKLIHFWQT